MTFRSSLETAVLLAPVLALYGAVAYGLRRRRLHEQAGLRTVKELALGVALTGVAVFTLLPGPSPTPLAVELVPFRSIYLNLQGDVTYGVMVIVANVALFVPVGFALRWFGLRTTRTALAAAVLSATVEVLQWTVVGGRVVSADDVLLNAVGGLLGAGVAAGMLPASTMPGRSSSDDHRSVGSCRSATRPP